ncbi:MAG: hypothetical protein HC794_07175 [Nitrospiraceae bacterium]|nr:hypothetical protein [Nitrospiraceae bacterium]
MGLVVYVVTSIAIAFTVNVGQMLTLRFFQAIGGGFATGTAEFELALGLALLLFGLMHDRWAGAKRDQRLAQSICVSVSSTVSS